MNGTWEKSSSPMWMLPPSLLKSWSILDHNFPCAISYQAPLVLPSKPPFSLSTSFISATTQSNALLSPFSFMHSCFLQPLHQKTPRMISKCNSFVNSLFLKAGSSDFHFPQDTTWCRWPSLQLFLPLSLLGSLWSNNTTCSLFLKNNPTPSFFNLPAWVFLSGKDLVQTSSSGLSSYLNKTFLRGTFISPLTHDPLS